MRRRRWRGRLAGSIWRVIAPRAGGPRRRTAGVSPVPRSSLEPVLGILDLAGREPRHPLCSRCRARGRRATSLTRLSKPGRRKLTRWPAGDCAWTCWPPARSCGVPPHRSRPHRHPRWRPRGGVLPVRQAPGGQSLRHRAVVRHGRRDTLRIREFLCKNRVPFTWLDLEADPQVDQLLRQFGVSEPTPPWGPGAAGCSCATPRTANWRRHSASAGRWIGRCTTWSWWGPGRPGSPPPSTRPPTVSTRLCWSARARAARPAAACA
jgi:hypothetical protein